MHAGPAYRQKVEETVRRAVADALPPGAAEVVTTSTRAVHGVDSGEETLLVVEPRPAVDAPRVHVEVHDGVLHLYVADGPVYEFYKGMGVDWLEHLAELVVAALSGRYEETSSGRTVTGTFHTPRGPVRFSHTGNH